MKDITPHEQYHPLVPPFDGFNKELPVQEALGTKRANQIQEASEIRSTNWVPGVSGWRLTRRGLELGASSGVFPAGSITFADLQTIATDKLLGRDTAGTGSVEQLAVSGGVEFSGAGGIQRSALTGDVTAPAASNTTTIANDAVTNAKAANMADSTVKGRASGAGTGDPTDLTASQVKAILALVAADISDFNAKAQAVTRKSLFDHYTDIGNVGTGEDDLYSDTIAAAQLAVNGEKLEAEYAGTFVSSATATREIKAYFGGTMIFDTGALTLSLSAAWTMYVTAIRVSASVVRCMVSLTTEGAALAAYTSYTEVTGLTLANTQVLKITGEAAGVGASSNDIVAKVGTVEWKAAA